MTGISCISALCVITVSVTTVIELMLNRSDISAVNVITLSVTGMIVLVGRIISYKSATLDVAGNVTVVSINVSNFSRFAAAYGITIGIACMVEYVFGCAGISAAYGITIGIACMVERMNDSSYVSAAFGITVSVTCMVVNMRNCSYASADFVITYGVARVGINVRRVGSDISASFNLAGSVANA